MIDYSVDVDGIATLTWDVSNRPMNVMNAASLGAFHEAFEKALADDAVKGVIIASARTEFIVGADLKMLQEVRSLEEMYAFFGALQAGFRRIEKCGKPVAAAINGHALGGGLEIAMSCHYRVVADSPRIKLGLPESKVGLMPGAGGTQRLPRLIGIQKALELMLEGKEVPPQQAQQLGMVHKVVPAAQLVAEAKRWLLEEGPANLVQPWDRKGFKIPGGAVQSPTGQQIFVAGNAMLHARTWGNYPAQRHIMSSVYEGLQTDIDTGLKIETRYLIATARSPEARNLIRFFFTMTDANKLARRPKDVLPRPPAKLGVIGAGMMGAGIAHVSAAAGMQVVLIDAEQAAADRGKAHAEQQLARRVQRGRMSESEAAAALQRLTPTTDYAALEGADLVIEAVFEDRGVKAEVTGKAEAVLAGNAVMASNTSTLPITGLAEASKRPANFIGIHFFSPVERMPLVEIIRGGQTSDEALACAMDYVQAIGKTPIVVNDSRGFYTSRVFGTYVREGLALLAEGVKPALIENAGRMSGMPVGPLALADEVSLELMHHIERQTRKDLGDALPENPGDGVVGLMVEQLGRIGKKAGKGFYEYPADGKKRLWPELSTHFPLAVEQPSLEQVGERLLFIQSVEAVRCLEEQVVTDPRDADLGSIMGWGFPPFLGGVIGQIETVGVPAFVARCQALTETCGARFTPPKLLTEMAARNERFYPQAAGQQAA